MLTGTIGIYPLNLDHAAASKDVEVGQLGDAPLETSQAVCNLAGGKAHLK